VRPAVVDIGGHSGGHASHPVGRAANVEDVASQIVLDERRRFFDSTVSVNPCLSPARPINAEGTFGWGSRRGHSILQCHFDSFGMSVLGYARACLSQVKLA